MVSSIRGQEVRHSFSLSLSVSLSLATGNKIKENVKSPSGSNRKGCWGAKVVLRALRLVG